jgi:serine protease inhibitor
MSKNISTLPFALSLLKKEVAAKSGENVLVSPLSVAVALGMTANGARNNTLTGILTALGLNGRDVAELNAGYAKLLANLKRADLGVRLDIANGVFAREGVSFHDTFLAANRAHFAAEVKALNFNAQESVDYINNWVSNNTQEKIAKLLNGGIDPTTILFLINAVYFKGEWTVKFDKSLTKTEDFAAAGGKIQHPLMYRQGSMVYGKDWQNDNYEYIALPFGESKAVRLVTFLPSAGKSIEDVLATLDIDTLKQASTQDYASDGELWLPRIDIQYDNDLNGSLIDLGMGDAFDSGKADFSAMRQTPPNVFVKKVAHKTVFKVDEEGAEGAAVTSVEAGIECVVVPFAMKVDRPFVTFVVDGQSDSVLFAGAINNPSK